MRAFALRNVCSGVGGAIFQATVPQELFLVALAMAGGSALIAQNCLQIAPFESKLDSAKLEPVLVLPTVRSCN
jgi:hypothetical protein